MKIAIRADASPKIGFGHVVRCSALAAELYAQGHDVEFLCARSATDGIGWLQSKGFPIRTLDASADGDVDSTPDAAATKTALEDFQADWLVVDHYGLDHNWEAPLRRHARILVIDDGTGRTHECDILVDPTLGATADAYRDYVPTECEIFAGPQYALLRPQFAKRRGTVRPRDGMLQRIAICTGGSDPQGLTARLVEAVLAADLKAVAIDAILGPAGGDAQALREKFAKEPRVSVHASVDDMATLFAEADFFIGASGGITWERACLGLPGITVAYAYNQQRIGEVITAAGAGIHLGDLSTARQTDLTVLLSLIARHPAWIVEMGRRIAQITDGRGAERIASSLSLPSLTLRPAGPDDCDALFEARNDPLVRRYSANGGTIDYQTHRAWFTRVLDSTDTLLFVAEHNSKASAPVRLGSVRYDIKGDEAVISIYLFPDQIGKGLGPRVIAAGDAEVLRRRPHVRRIIAKVSHENNASRRSFAKAGYIADTEILHKQAKG